MEFFLFNQKTAYEMLRSLVGSEMCIRDRAIPLGTDTNTFIADGALGIAGPVDQRAGNMVDAGGWIDGRDQASRDRVALVNTCRILGLPCPHGASRHVVLDAGVIEFSRVERRLQRDAGIV